MAKVVAIVEDEPDIAELESETLKKEGFLTRVFYNSDVFLQSLSKDRNGYALLLLDIMLPGISGTDLLKLLRNSPDYETYKSLPVIIVSAKDNEIDKVLGLEFGADDYLAKPFGPRELIARVKAVLRRADEKSTTNTMSSILRVGDIVIDENRFIVLLKDEPVVLTTVEFKILALLAKRKGWVFDRNKLIDLLWGGEKYVTDRTIDVHIKHLREKLGASGSLIKTLRGIGYKIDEE